MENPLNYFTCFEKGKAGIQCAYGAEIREKIREILDQHQGQGLTFEILARHWGLKSESLRRIDEEDYSSVDMDVLDAVSNRLGLRVKTVFDQVRFGHGENSAEAWAERARKQRFVTLAGTGGPSDSGHHEVQPTPSESVATSFVVVGALTSLGRSSAAGSPCETVPLG